MKPRKPTIPALLLLMPLFAACPTPADDVCADLGLCATWGSAQAPGRPERGRRARQRGLRRHAVGHPSTPTSAALTGPMSAAAPPRCFPGCGPDRAALDGCLSKERASNSCGALAVALAHCPAPDAGTTVPDPCGARELCAAHCYLTDVADPCAPLPAELALSGSCSGLCL